VAQEDPSGTVFPLLYAVLALEILVFFILGQWMVSLIQIGFIAAAGTLRFLTGDRIDPGDLSLWTRVRRSVAEIYNHLQILTLEERQTFGDLLPVRKRLFPVLSADSRSEESVNYTSDSYGTQLKEPEVETFGVSFRNSVSMDIITEEELISQLRLIGVDGTLILLFLLRNINTVITTKIMNSYLPIPQSTLYRVVQKLADQRLIELKSSMEDPGIGYYNISYDGEILLRTFYQSFWN
jgi:DNA-binding HxlR family transcriptional regulator